MSIAEWHGESARPLPRKRISPRTLAVVAMMAVGLYLTLYNERVSVGLSSFIALGAFFGDVAYRRLSPNEESVAPDPVPESHFFVAVQLYREKIRYGEDFGVISFTDGWAHFEGDRTSFSLRPCDLEDVRSTSWKQSEPAPHGYYSISSLDRWFFVAPNEIKISIGLKLLASRGSVPPGKEFARTLDRWLDGVSPEGEPYYPPLGPSARFLAESRQNARRNAQIGWIGFLATLAFALAWYMGASWPVPQLTMWVGVLSFHQIVYLNGAPPAHQKLSRMRNPDSPAPRLSILHRDLTELWPFHREKRDELTIEESRRATPTITDDVSMPS